MAGQGNWSGIEERPAPSMRDRALFWLALAISALALGLAGAWGLADAYTAEAIEKNARVERVVAAHRAVLFSSPCDVTVVQSLPSGREPTYGCYSRKSR